MKITACVPLVIYLILFGLSLVSYILSGAILDNTANVLLHLVSATAVSGLLYWLCSIKYNKTAWLILLLPVIILVLILLSFITGMTALSASALIDGKTSGNISSGRASADISSNVRTSIN